MRSFMRWCALVALVAAAGSCGSSGDESSADSGFGAGDRFSVMGALAQLPVDDAMGRDGTILVAVADLLAVGEAVGHDRPTGSIDEDEILEWLGIGDVAAPVYVALPRGFDRGFSDPGEYTDEVGFFVADLDATIWADFDRIRFLTVLAGELEPATSTEVADGVLTIGDGPDGFIDFSKVTIARNLGRPLRIAVDDDLVFMSQSTDAALAWLDPVSPRLDEDEAFAAAAAILDDRDVISAVMFRDDFASDLPDGNHVTTAFDTIAVGWAVEGGDPAIAVVYIIADEEAVEAAAAEIEAALVSGVSLVTDQPIADLVIVEDVSIEGSAVVAVLSLPPENRGPGIILSMIQSADTPFVYGR